MYFKFECTKQDPLFVLSTHTVNIIQKLAPELEWDIRVDVCTFLAWMAPYFYTEMESIPVKTVSDMLTLAGCSEVEICDDGDGRVDADPCLKGVLGTGQRRIPVTIRTVRAEGRQTVSSIAFERGG